ncbi:unnamed protein product [Discosporangium mesarthrocarpum]
MSHEQSPVLSSVFQSCGLTVETWKYFRELGVCASCYVRLRGCTESQAFSYGEEALRAHLDMSRDSSTDDPAKSTHEITREKSVGKVDPVADSCCPLCLGLLQQKVHVSITPRVTNTSPRSTVPYEAAELSSMDADYTNTLSSGKSKESGRKNAGTAGARTFPGEGADKKANVSSTKRELAEAIAESARSRGYSLKSFGLTVSVPGCLAVRQVAFLEAHGNLLECSRRPPVDVKDALKMTLASAVEVSLGVPVDKDPDFIIEVVAKAPEADVEAAEVLEVPPLKQACHGTWQRGGGPGDLRKRRRREGRRPGLTAGMVKKSLTELSAEQRGKMKTWTKGWGRRPSVCAGRDGVGDRGDGTEGVTTWRQGMGEGGVIANAQGKAVSKGMRRGREFEVKALGAEGVVDSSGRGVDALSGAPENAVQEERVPKIVPGNTAGRQEGVGAKGGTPPAVEKEAQRPGSESQEEPPGYQPPSLSVPAPLTLSPLPIAWFLVTLHREPICLQGRYNKMSRMVPQTPWIKGYFSVQEALSEPIEAFTQCLAASLHGGGREDMDVRMLGGGRPFVLQLYDSLRNATELSERLPLLEVEVNSAQGSRNQGGGVRVSGLAVAAPGATKGVCSGFEGQKKRYRCVVWVSRAITPADLKELSQVPRADNEVRAQEGQDRREGEEAGGGVGAGQESLGLVVQQRTPIRVLHRRTLMSRPKSVYCMEAEWINAHFFVLNVTTSGGTYIKEFIHGDLGRTNPSIASLLGCQADILQLDVVGIVKADGDQGEISDGSGSSS